MTEQNEPVTPTAETTEEPVGESIILQPKRRMGNPNWVKGYKRAEYAKKEESKKEESRIEENGENLSHLQDDLVWIKMFTAIAMNAQCNCSGTALIITATQADYALTLYKSRFK